MSELLVFQTFADREQATRVAATLENHGITVNVEENIGQLDSNFIGQQFGNPFCVKIPGNSFVAANAILLEHTKVDLNEVDSEYILFSMSNDELIDVMFHRDEWGIYNYKLAEQILLKRNVAIPIEKINKAQDLAIEMQYQPANYSSYWIVIGYVFALISLYVFYTDIGLVFFAFPTLFALVVGFRLFFTKKTVANGDRIWAYTTPSRIHGLVIFILTVIITLLRSQYIVTPFRPHF